MTHKNVNNKISLLCCLWKAQDSKHSKQNQKKETTFFHILPRRKLKKNAETTRKSCVGQIVRKSGIFEREYNSPESRNSHRDVPANLKNRVGKFQPEKVLNCSRNRRYTRHKQTTSDEQQIRFYRKLSISRKIDEKHHL